jgi:hypothetical protein
MRELREFLDRMLNFPIFARARTTDPLVNSTDGLPVAAICRATALNKPHNSTVANSP